MFGLSKKERAASRLNASLKAVLVGRSEIEKAIRHRYRDKWDGFVNDVVSGTLPHDEAISLVSIFIIDALGREMTKEQAREFVATINENRTTNRPPLFDLIDQIAFHSWVCENSGDATKGLTAAFLNSLAEFFAADDEGLQERVTGYFIESMRRYREVAHDH
jgi:hypothetical protein